LDLSREAKYEVRQIKEDPTRGAPARIYVDITGARLAMAAKDAVSVEDELLRQVRVGQYTVDVVRVVLDMQTLRNHKTFLLSDPYRLVIDVEGPKQPDKLAAKEKEAFMKNRWRPPARRNPKAPKRRPHHHPAVACARSSWIQATAARIPAPSAPLVPRKKISS
jgi:hypothetical protein